MESKEYNKLLIDQEMNNVNAVLKREGLQRVRTRNKHFIDYGGKRLDIILYKQVLKAYKDTKVIDPMWSVTDVAIKLKHSTGGTIINLLEAK